MKLKIVAFSLVLGLTSFLVACQTEPTPTETIEPTPAEETTPMTPGDETMTPGDEATPPSQ
ncbi:hypothetical protein [Coleofasciculus sp. G2-EDA-02]|uniref:hypothetical protein n=1 Tax=Coleofasciculus sp. G2-EDA-02 TaxID=3069529 RepID=UPI0032F563DB